MAADTVDSYHLRSAYTNGPKFDVPVRREHFNLSMNGHQDERVEADIPMCNTEVNMKDSPSRHWEPDVSGLISARKWLNNFGLKKNRLDIQHLLPAMGFQLSEDFDFTLKKPVTSKYGNGLFNQAFRPDGKTFNITADKAKLRVLEARLMQAILLYRRRLEWLTTESRRIFGVIEEKCVVIVLDIRNLSPQQFDQYRCALERVLREQVSQLTKFNIIRAAEDVEMYNKDCLPVTHDTLEGAVEWLWNLNRLAAVSRTATCEAVVAALMDRNAEAVYLFTEGAAVDGSREILKEKIVKLQKKTPVHVVSYNCTDSDTIHYLRELSRLTAAKFHAYAVTMEMDVYESLPVNPKNSRANVVVKRRTYGGVPSGAGVREDVFLVFEELEAARGNLDKLRAVIKQLPDPKFVLQSKIEKPVCLTESREEYLSSSEWLKTYGLSPQKLGLYDILAGVVFKHQDGVISVLEKPCHPHQTDAVSREKLVNARYCDRFPVVRWKDDCLVHVQVSPDIHRNYEQKMNTALHKIQQRIDWLKQGSRELFGTVLEEKIYILVDTSSSMVPHMQFVKDKLYLLLQEQLRHKMKFNLVSFNTRCSSWRDRLMDVTEPNLQSAWAWIQGLTCQGSTNTYAALQAAMGDNQTQAIYLLTDGRPDQPPKSVIAQVQMQNRVPIHTISFNCNDVTANQFLCSLANTTKGRFHYFNETGVDIDIPEKYESEDIHLLKKEYDEGLRQLEKVRELRDQCASLAWNQERDSLRKSSNGSRSSVSSSLQRRSLASDPTPRPRSAPPRDAQLGPALSARPSTALGTYSQPTPSQSPRISAKFSRRPPTASNNKTTDRPPNKAAHTRTSLLRTLSSSGRFTPDTWLLPETKEILNRQASRQTDKTKKLEDVEAGTKVTKRGRKKLNKKQSLGRDADLTVKQWLGRHGLAARKLTILDALAPTMVPHRAKYVPILDKHVLAKVFNNVLPLAHVSGRDQKQIQLINPNAVNLVEYEDRLQEAVTLYIQKLDQVVWDAIPQAARTEFESEEPVSFLDNKIKMMRLLKEASWPVSSRDISLLEAEITRAEKFLQQSRDLRRVAKDHQQREPPAKLPGHNTQDLETSIDSAKVNESSRDKLSDVEEETRTGADSERTDGATERTDGAPEDDADVYEDQASVVSSIAREQEAEAELQEKESLPNEKKKDGVSSRKKRVSPGVRNQRVIARREADGLYYTGSVVGDEGERTVRVEFDDWEGEVVPARYTIPISGAVACPLLRVGDYVLVRVMNTETDSEVYIPGVVQVTPQRVTDSTKFYTVLTYNAQRVTTMRNHMIKMTKVRFELCCRYIRQKLMEDIKEPDVVRPSSPVPDSDKEDGQEDVIDDLRHRLEDQQDIIEDQEREIRHHRDKIAKLKKKQRRMKTTETALEKLFLKKEKLSATAGDVSDDESTPPELILLRRSLAPITNIGEEVLARWPDDGWYYRGTVLGGHKGQYLIEDCGQSKEDIWRENIITDADCAHHLLKVSDAVVAAHPDFCFSYAPGRVIDIQDQAIMVQFYDGQNATVPSDEVYCLHTEKYQHDVTYIQKCDTGRVGQPVIARDDKTGYFQPGFIEEKVGDKSQFIVRWRDGSSTLQKTMYIFGKFLKRYRLEVGERVLALADRSKDVYLPGLIKHKQGTQLTVKFCDGSVGDVDGDSLDCFWMAETFYDDAVLFYRSKSGKTDLS